MNTSDETVRVWVIVSLIDISSSHSDLFVSLLASRAEYSSTLVAQNSASEMPMPTPTDIAIHLTPSIQSDKKLECYCLQAIDKTSKPYCTVQYQYKYRPVAAIPVISGSTEKLFLEHSQPSRLYGSR